MLTGWLDLSVNRSVFDRGVKVTRQKLTEIYLTLKLPVTKTWDFHQRHWSQKRWKNIEYVEMYELRFIHFAGDRLNL